jgi:hypothetical protein
MLKAFGSSCPAWLEVAGRGRRVLAVAPTPGREVGGGASNPDFLIYPHLGEPRPRRRAFGACGRSISTLKCAAFDPRRCSGQPRPHEELDPERRYWNEVEAVHAHDHSAVQPAAVQTMRAGGSLPRLTAASTGLRPCVLKASRVSSATGPFSSLSMAARETSTRVQTSRPSEAVDLIDQEAPKLLLSGVSRADSRTRHSSATVLA